MKTKPQILFVDAYDSFSNNIVSLLETELEVEVTKTFIDTDLPNLHASLKDFSAVVLGPGPGDPNNAHDVGITNRIWEVVETCPLPVFGVCLGFQHLVLKFGGKVVRLAEPRHGIENRVRSRETDIWRGLREVTVVQYHSLHAVLGHLNTDARGEDPESLWEASTSCPDLIPLAWDFDRACTEDGRDKLNPGSILMSVRHRTRPFWGVQFHPESICSSMEARQVVINWWEDAQIWKKEHRQLIGLSDIRGYQTPPRTIYDKHGFQNYLHELQHHHSVFNNPPTPPVMDLDAVESEDNPISPPNRLLRTMHWEELDLDDLTVAAVCHVLGLGNGEAIVLDSEQCQIPTLGDHSIVGLVAPKTLKIVYSVGTKHVRLERANEVVVIELGQDDSIFLFIEQFMHDHQILDRTGLPSDSPFWGGLLGYIAYEACLETISVPSNSHHGRPDICFAFIERSVVINHARRKAYVQSIKENDNVWVDPTAETLRRLSDRQQDLRASVSLKSLARVSFDLPTESSYHTKIRACHDEIRAGNSYELCLTDQTRIHINDPTKATPWTRYLNLRTFNPAPFSSYIRLGPLTVLSTSPERFMSWTRPSATAQNPRTKQSICQFRPIKGTVRKRQPLPSGEFYDVSLAEATVILSSQKERAENLMIVDLIRHDLHGVAGSGNVVQKSLMQVEEYEHVYQLVSVIEGTLHQIATPSVTAKTLPRPYPTGISLLHASLPPGSMTGAPKKRTCALLTNIEDHQPRSIYSGVIGYMDVGGGGDFSVVIRTSFRWDDEQAGLDDGEEIWRVGAGGAVTGLSTATGEWEEMLAKLESNLGFWKRGGV